MLTLFYNYAKQTPVPQGGGVAIVPRFAFADYIAATLTVYSSGTTAMDLSSVASWRGCVDVDTDVDTEPLVRILPGSFDATDAATGKLGFVIDCNTTNFRDRIKAATAGFLELYGHDSADRQIVRIRIATTMQLPGDPPGDHDPLAVPASSVRTLNGQPGAVVINSSAGTALPAADGVIALSKAAVGLGNVADLLDNLAATSAPTATADSAAGYAAGSLWIDVAHGKAYTCVDPTAGAAVWTEGGAGDVTAAGDNTFDGANTFTQPLTVAGNFVDGLHRDRNPLDAYEAYDDTLRGYTWLDGTAASPKVVFRDYQMGLREVAAKVQSDNAESSGNAVLVAKRPDGTEVARFTVAVTPTATLKTLMSFDGIDGALEMTRDTADAADTLAGAIQMYAITTWSA